MITCVFMTMTGKEEEVLEHWNSTAWDKRPFTVGPPFAWLSIRFLPLSPASVSFSHSSAPVGKRHWGGSGDAVTQNCVGVWLMIPKASFPVIWL